MGNIFGQMFSTSIQRIQRGITFKITPQKSNIEAKKGTISKESSLPTTVFKGHVSFRGSIFLLSTRIGEGKSKAPSLVLPGGPTGQFAAKPTATATESGHSARLDL